MGKTRVLVVEDSLTVRKHLVETIRGDPDLEVAAEAADGREACEICARLRPDVVALDMMLPGMSGLEATERIMAYCPTPILIVSSSMERGEVFRTYQALAAGAVDVLDKPRADRFEERWEREFLSKLKLIARIKVITHPRAKLAGQEAEVRPPPEPAPGDRAGRYRCVAIGASTGGPRAVLDVLRGLADDFPLPILLVIHIGEPFGPSLCEWLDDLSPIRVAYGTDGLPLPAPGERPIAVMAPHDRHLVVARGRARLRADPERHSCRPSVDVLFESVALEFGPAAIGCLLTGMGIDGAAGLAAIRRAGGLTIAQDEASCVVFGMPREAIRRGAAAAVLPLAAIAPALRSAAMGERAAAEDRHA